MNNEPQNKACRIMKEVYSACGLSDALPELPPFSLDILRFKWSGAQW